MKKNNVTLIIFLIVGLFAGSIIAKLLQPIEALAFLAQSAEFAWEPKADLDFLKYDLKFQIKLSLISILGLIAGFWIYRKI
jgi:uncharacterized protein YneF (UPF0154 family)